MSHGKGGGEEATAHVKLKGFRDLLDLSNVSLVLPLRREPQPHLSDSNLAVGSRSDEEDGRSG